MIPPTDNDDIVRDSSSETISNLSVWILLTPPVSDVEDDDDVQGTNSRENAFSDRGSIPSLDLLTDDDSVSSWYLPEGSSATDDIEVIDGICNTEPVTQTSDGASSTSVAEFPSIRTPMMSNSVFSEVTERKSITSIPHLLPAPQLISIQMEPSRVANYSNQCIMISVVSKPPILLNVADTPLCKTPKVPVSHPLQRTEPITTVPRGQKRLPPQAHGLFDTPSPPSQKQKPNFRIIPSQVDTEKHPLLSKRNSQKQPLTQKQQRPAVSTNPFFTPVSNNLSMMRGRLPESRRNRGSPTSWSVPRNLNAENITYLPRRKKDGDVKKKQLASDLGELATVLWACVNGATAESQNIDFMKYAKHFCLGSWCSDETDVKDKKGHEDNDSGEVPPQFHMDVVRRRPQPMRAQQPPVCEASMV